MTDVSANLRTLFLDLTDVSANLPTMLADLTNVSANSHTAARVGRDIRQIRRHGSCFPNLSARFAEVASASRADRWGNREKVVRSIAHWPRHSSIWLIRSANHPRHSSISLTKCAHHPRHSSNPTARKLVPEPICEVCRSRVGKPRR